MVDLQLNISDDFFKEEYRCGYLVTTEMKKVWAVELDLLNQIQLICKKYNIQYFASAGTILGAVRHKGFIPWDDDIDIMLLRSQYEELCRHADEFKFPYFFQTYEREKDYYLGHAQLRNSLTTGILRSTVPNWRKYNQGIFIDIFPVDAIPDNKIKKLIQKKACTFLRYHIIKNYNMINFPLENKKKQILYPFVKAFNNLFSYDKLYKIFIDLCKIYNNQKTTLVSKLSFKPYDEKLYQYRTDFDQSVLMDFEMLKIPIPVNYDQLLRYKYGNDYMEFKQSRSYHGGVIFDTDIPYDQYIENYNINHNKH